MKLRHALLGILPLAFAVFAVAHGSGETKVIGAIGDSITAGFDARHLGDNRELSWSTGNSPDIQSHLHRLEQVFGANLEARNEAIAGSVASDLDRQITRILVYTPDFVTVAIGANDICGWGRDYEADRAAFEGKVRAALHRILDSDQGAHITLAPIPNIYNLWEVAHDKPSCQTKWNIVNLCAPLLGRDRTEQDRQDFVARWRVANQTLGRIAAEFPATQLSWDPSMADTRFEWEHVSQIDCFHPSVLGQNLLAEKTWQAIH